MTEPRLLRSRCRDIFGLARGSPEPGGERIPGQSIFSLSRHAWPPSWAGFSPKWLALNMHTTRGRHRGTSMSMGMLRVCISRPIASCYTWSHGPSEIARTRSSSNLPGHHRLTAVRPVLGKVARQSGPCWRSTLQEGLFRDDGRMIQPRPGADLVPFGTNQAKRLRAQIQDCKGIDRRRAVLLARTAIGMCFMIHRKSRPPPSWRAKLCSPAC